MVIVITIDQGPITCIESIQSLVSRFSSFLFRSVFFLLFFVLLHFSFFFLSFCFIFSLSFFFLFVCFVYFRSIEFVALFEGEWHAILARLFGSDFFKKSLFGGFEGMVCTIVNIFARLSRPLLCLTVEQTGCRKYV